MIVGISAGIAGFFFGYLICAFFMARDPSVVRLNSDEVIVKKPADGLILVAVTQPVARRLILQDGLKEKSVLEARDL